MTPVLSAVDGPTLRRVCGLFVTGVTVITSELDGRPMGTTVNSFSSVSLAPPLVLFCLHRDSRMLSALNQSESFAVNFLSGRQEGLAWSFAKADRGDDLATLQQRSETGIPILGGVLSFLACRVVNKFEGGDHLIVVGEVLEVGGSAVGKKPLIFFGGALGTLEEELHSLDPVWDG